VSSEGSTDLSRLPNFNSFYLVKIVIIGCQMRQTEFFRDSSERLQIWLHHSRDARKLRVAQQFVHA